MWKVTRELREAKAREREAKDVAERRAREEAERLERLARVERDKRYPWFLPVGQLTLLVGHPGVGKSLVALDYAARLAKEGVVDPLEEGENEAVLCEAGAEVGVIAGGAPSGEVRAGVPGPLEGLGGEAKGELEVDGKCEKVVASGGEVAERRGRVGVSLMLSAEDTTEAVNQRIEACGGHGVMALGDILSLVPAGGQVGASWRSEEGKSSSLVGFIEGMEKVMGRVDLRAVVLDPLPAFLGKFDSGSAASVRILLKPLLALAEKRGFAVIGVTHLNKGLRSRSVLHQTIGSLAYTALARSVLMVMEDDVPGRRVVIPVKNNLAAAKYGWGFWIESREKGPAVVWEKEAVRKHEMLPRMEGMVVKKSEEEEMAVSQLEFAMEFLKVELAAGPRGTEEVLKGAGRVGISKRTVERARRRMGVGCRRDGERGEWVMEGVGGARGEGLGVRV